MLWHERLKMWMRSENNMTAADLAKRSGVDVETIYQWLKGAVDNPRGNKLAKVAEVFGKTDIELRHGDKVSGTRGLKKVPLLSMNKLGTIRIGQDPRSLWDGVSTVTVSDDVGENAFAIVINEDSLAPEFKINDQIIVDPDRELIPGRFVVAVVNRLKKAVCMRYAPSDIEPGAPFTLTAEDSHFPPIKIEDAAAGFIVGRSVKFIRDI